MAGGAGVGVGVCVGGGIRQSPLVAKVADKSRRDSRSSIDGKTNPFMVRSSPLSSPLGTLAASTLVDSVSPARHITGYVSKLLVITPPTPLCAIIGKTRSLIV